MTSLPRSVNLTLEEYKEDLKRKLKKVIRTQNAMENQFEIIRDNAEVDIPEVMIEKKLAYAK